MAKAKVINSSDIRDLILSKAPEIIETAIAVATGRISSSDFDGDPVLLRELCKIAVPQIDSRGDTIKLDLRGVGPEEKISRVFDRLANGEISLDGAMSAVGLIAETSELVDASELKAQLENIAAGGRPTYNFN